MKSLASFPIIAFITIIVTLGQLDIRTPFDPPYLLPVLNALFLSVTPFFVAFIAGRIFLATGNRTALLLGCGMVSLGLGGLISGWFIGGSGGPNVTITIYNTGVLFCSFFHAAGAILTVAPPAANLSNNRKPMLATFYICLALILIALDLAAVKGLTPPLIVQGAGPTLLGRMILGTAIILLGTSSVFFIKRHINTRERLFFWYGMGLLLVATGLTGVFLQKAVGSPIGWVGRFAQYTGGLYILIGTWRFYRTLHHDHMTFEAAIAGIFSEAEANYKALIDAARDAIVSINGEGRVLLWSNAAENIFGYSRKEAIGNSLKDLILTNTYPEELQKGPVFQSRNSVTTSKAEETSILMEAKVRARDGSFFPAEISASTRTASSGVITTLIIKDITERKRVEEELDRYRHLLEEQVRKRTEELSEANQKLHEEIAYHKQTGKELQRAEEKYRSIFENAVEGVFQTTLGGRFLSANRALAHILGYESPEDLMASVTDIGRQLYVNHEERTEYLRLIDEAGEVKDFEARMHHKDGGICWVSINTRLVRDSDGNPRHYEGFIEDITDHRRVEREREKLDSQNRQLQKAESLGRMAGAIAHHFNNKLGVVIGNLELAMDDMPRHSGPAGNLTAAMDAANKAAEVSGLMLTYLGQTTGKREPLDVSEICRRHLPMLRTFIPPNVIMETDLPSPGPVISANENQIQQALTNLVTNAWEACGDGRGTIHLRVKTVSPAEISIERRPIGWQPKDDSYACLEVRDGGSGIAVEDMENLFDPFFSSKFAGRGLGLPLVLGIVRAHGGALEVESAPGQGSVFRVFLPLSAAAAPPQSDKAGSSGDTLPQGAPMITPERGKASSPVPAEGSGMMLLVEDEEMVRNMAAAMLTRLGFTVLAVKDGVEAVEVFRQHQDEIRFVLSDLTMPRMNGWETLAALRKLQPDIPVILASGYDKNQVMSGNHPEWPQVFLGKPYNRKGLGDAIDQALRKKKSLIEEQNDD